MHTEHHEHHQHVALAVFATCAVTAIIVGVLVYQFEEHRFEKQLSKTDNELQLAGNLVQELQTEKNELTTKVDKVSEALSTISTENSKRNFVTGGIELPLVRFQAPGQFTEEEINELWKKLIEPYTTYNDLLEGDNPVGAILIEKYDNKSSYRYGVDALHSTGMAGFVFGEKGKDIPYWKPECMGVCPYPEGFKQKYPELIETE